MLPPHPPPFHPASPSVRSDSPSAKSLYKFYSPSSPYASLPPSPAVYSPGIAAPTPGYPSSQMPSPLVVHGAHDGYFSPEFATNKKLSPIITDFESHQSGLHRSNTAPGTPHTKKGELPRAGAVPLSPDRGMDYSTSSDSSPDTLSPGSALDAVWGRVMHILPSSLYDANAPIRYSIAFKSVVPTSGPNGGAALTAALGLMPGPRPTRNMKDRELLLFSGMNGSINYVFQAHGYNRVEREVELMDSVGLKMSTVGECACSLVRGFVVHSTQSLGLIQTRSFLSA